MWIPILSSTPSSSLSSSPSSTAQMGSLCLSVTMIPQESQQYEEFLQEKEALLSGQK